MIRQRKAGDVIVSYLSRHRSLNRKSQQPARRKKRLSKVIHVTIGSGSEVSSTNNNSHRILDKQRKKSLTKNQILQDVLPTHRHHPSFLQFNSQTKKNNNSTSKFSTQTSHLTRSSRVAHHQSKTQLSDQTDLTNDYQHKLVQKKKNKCSRRCFIVSLLITMLIVAIILSISLALTLKSQTKTTSPILSNACSIATTPVLRWNTTGITVAGLAGKLGNTSTLLNAPLDTMLDWANNLYIADCYNYRIQKYLFNTAVGSTVAGNGTRGSSPSQLYYPSRILMDSNGNLYISDTSNHRIQFWNNGATNGTTIAGVSGVSGLASNRLNTPYGIAFHPTSGALYISDCLNHRLMSYPSGAKNGTVLLGGNGQGTNNTQLNTPVGLYYESLSNSLVIANYGAHNIVRYAFGATSWTLVAGNGNGTPGTSLNGPIDVIFDPMGNMYVADIGYHCIQFFSAGGTNGTTIVGISGAIGTNATTLNGPWKVTLDNQLNLYVTDTNNHRIQKFLRY